MFRIAPVRHAATATVAAVVLTGCLLPAQTQKATAGQAKPTDWPATVKKAIEHRRYGMRLAVSRKIAGAGDAAVPAIRAYGEAKGIDRIPLLLVNAIASASGGGPATLGLLDEWARDKAFYWRAQALGGLADRKLVGHRDLFREAVGDPSHLFRVEGARGLYLLGAAAEGGKGDPSVARGLVERDLDPRVRIRLAAFLSEQGDPCGLPVLVAAMQLSSDFLGDPWGRREATRAFKAAKKMAGEDFGFDVSADPDANAAAIEAFRAAFRKRVPDWREPTFSRSDKVFAGGVSVRSCRNGDLFLRWTEDGEVVAGLVPAVGAVVPADTWARLRSGLNRLAEHDTGTLGKVVCDFMLVQSLAAEGGARPARTWKCAPGRLVAGAAGVSGELGAWLADLASGLAQSQVPPLADEIRRRLGQFSSAGGK